MRIVYKIRPRLIQVHAEHPFRDHAEKIISLAVWLRSFSRVDVSPFACVYDLKINPDFVVCCITNYWSLSVADNVAAKYAQICPTSM